MCDAVVLPISSSMVSGLNAKTKNEIVERHSDDESISCLLGLKWDESMCASADRVGQCGKRM